MKPGRADLIVPAAEIFLTIMKISGIDKIVVPEMGLADGMDIQQFDKQMRKNPARP